MPTTRRDVLAGLSALTVGAAERGAEPRRRPRPSHRFAMVVDVGKCIGCQACTVSCIFENAVPAGLLPHHRVDLRGAGRRAAPPW